MPTLLRRLHPVTGSLSILCIGSFMTASIVAELYGDASMISTVKRAILWGLLVLIPCLATTGLSGDRATSGAPRGLALVKLRCMRIIGLNGICVLVPYALFLATRTAASRFGWPFYGIYALELLAVSINHSI